MKKSINSNKHIEIWRLIYQLSNYDHAFKDCLDNRISLISGSGEGNLGDISDILRRGIKKTTMYLVITEAV